MSDPIPPQLVACEWCGKLGWDHWDHLCNRTGEMRGMCPFCGLVGGEHRVDCTASLRWEPIDFPALAGGSLALLECVEWGNDVREPVCPYCKAMQIAETGHYAACRLAAHLAALRRALGRPA